MQLSALASTSEAVAATSSRSEKVSLLTALLHALAPEEIETGVSYLAGTLRQGRIGLGPSTLRRVRSSPATTPNLSLLDADRVFARIAEATGAGSAGVREELLGALFRRASAQEQTFLARLVLGELRQGALEGVMITALARAADVPVSMVRRATMLTGDLARVAAVALGDGSRGLSALRLELLRPIQPMLAQSADDVDAALARLEQATFELKLDGARVQIHKRHEEVRVFSRQLNDVTAAVPEIVAAVGALPARELILDGEAIALREDGRPHPFQTTMRRFGRRRDVETLRTTLPLSVQCFDCLHLEGQDLIDDTATTRLAALDACVPPALRVPRLQRADAHAAQRFFDDAIAAGHEGVMAKDPDAKYAAGRRGGGWLKIKHAHTLDLVVLAAEWGSGRRRGYLSNLHLGARDEQGFVMLGKTFKGLSDEMLAWQTARLLELETGRDRHTVYVRPALVVEIALNEVQSSPQYPAGLALRFARVKHYRTDKTPAQADTLATVRALHDASR